MEELKSFSDGSNCLMDNRIVVNAIVVLLKIAQSEVSCSRKKKAAKIA